MSKHNRKILQLIPADVNTFVWARYSGSDDIRVLAWALVEDELGDRYVVAMVGDNSGRLDLATDASNFEKLIFS